MEKENEEKEPWIKFKSWKGEEDVTVEEVNNHLKANDLVDWVSEHNGFAIDGDLLLYSNLDPNLRMVDVKDLIKIQQIFNASELCIDSTDENGFCEFFLTLSWNPRL